MEKTLEFLKIECQRLGFPSDSYKLGRAPSPGLGEIAIDFRDGLWIVYHFERGREEDICTFQNRRSAIEYFFVQLILISGSNILSDFNLAEIPD